MGWREDDVVHALTSRWRPSATILAAGASQVAMCFTTPDGRRRAPDLVAFTEARIVVIEAKVRAAALFAGGSSSDAETLRAFAAAPTSRAAFLEKSRALLASMGVECAAAQLDLVVGLLAGSPFSAEQLGAAAGLVCIEATEDGELAVVRGADALPIQVEVLESQR